MNIPIIDATMVQDSKGQVAAVSGDNLTKQITFVLARKAENVDLANFTPMISVEPVQGENYNLLPEMAYDEEQVYIVWRLTRFDTQYSGKLYATVKLMQPTADGDVCVWQSNRGCFHITSSVAADADADAVAPNVFESVITEAAEHAAAAKSYRDEAQSIKDSTEIEFVVEESRIGLRHVGDAEFVYTDDLKGDGEPNQNAYSNIMISSKKTGPLITDTSLVSLFAHEQESGLGVRLYDGIKAEFEASDTVKIHGTPVDVSNMGMMTPDDKKKLDALAESMGDIDTALDHIIAIAESLIGGADA